MLSFSRFSFHSFLRLSVPRLIGQRLLYTRRAAARAAVVVEMEILYVPDYQPFLQHVLQSETILAPEEDALVSLSQVHRLAPAAQILSSHRTRHLARYHLCFKHHNRQVRMHQTQT